MESFDRNTAWTHEPAGHFFVKRHRCGHVGHAQIQSDCRKIFDDVSDETAWSTETSHMAFFGNFIALNGDFDHAYVIGRVVHPLIIITYLRFRMSKNEVNPLPEKETDLLNAETPKNTMQLISFLGILNYYHRHLPYLVHILEPLHKLLLKRQ